MLYALLICLVLGSVIAQDEECRIDLAFAVDGSGSIEVDNPVKGNWQLVVNFLSDVINGSIVGPEQSRVAMVKFDDRATVHFQLDTFDNKSDILEAAKALDYNRGGGRTNTDGALTLIRNTIFQQDNGDRSDVRNVVILLTDGRPTDVLNANLNATILQLKADEVRLIGVGVTEDVDVAFMEGFVSDKETDFFSVEDFDNLNQILSQILEQSCRVVTDCTNEADVFMVMDGSGSIDQQNFDLMKEFAVTLVDRGLSIDSGRVKAGFVMFSDDAQMLYDLNRFSTREDMNGFIRNIQYPRGRTNTASAINMVMNDGFTSQSGDRDTVQNVLVLFTDGNSNNPEATFAAAYAAKAQDIHIITVGIGGWVNSMELILLSSYPYEMNYISVSSFQALNEELRGSLTDLICNNANDCRNDPCVSGTCEDRIGMYMCTCVTGIAGKNCDTPCRTPSDVVFALDSSGSVGRENFLTEIDFVRDLVMGLNINLDSQVGALQYANNAQLQFDLNDFSSKIGVLNALAMLYLDGTTNTASAISMMRNQMFSSGNGDRSSAPNVGVVLTDGRSNDFTATWSEARQARARGIEMIAVGIGNNLRAIELEAIASHPVNLNVLTTGGFDTLGELSTRAIEAICNNIDACGPPNPCQNEGVCIDLLNSYRCECQDGWSGVNCERNCDKRYDIILAIDTSGSIRNERMPQILDFIVEIVEEFEVSDQAAQFGAISFSDTAQVEFNLNSYSTQQDVITAIKTIGYSGGRTNIAACLEEIKDNMFTGGRGDRVSVQNYIVLFTDGESNIREDETMQMAIDARVEGIKILTVAIGAAVNMLEMRGITSRPTSNMMEMAESFTDMTNNQQIRTQIRDKIIAASCNDVNECGDNPCVNGQCTDDLHTYICQCNNDFSGENCDRRCTNQMDVVLVLDFSGSLDQVSDVIIAFAREIVHGLPFTLNRARVGVISYSDTATKHFELDDYTTKEEVLNALSFSRYGGRTNTAAALQMTYDELFRTDRGDRNGVDNIAIIVTDGGSNIQRDQTNNRATDMKNRGIEVYVAAVYNAPDMGEVNNIASDPDNEHVVPVPNAESVASAANQLLERLCL